MFLVAKLAFLSIGEEHARQRGCVIEDLEFVQIVTYTLTIVLHLASLKEGFILRLKH